MERGFFLFVMEGSPQLSGHSFYVVDPFFAVPEVQIGPMDVFRVDLDKRSCERLQLQVLKTR